MVCSKFCSKKNKYHRTFGPECNLARVDLSLEVEDSDEFVTYRYTIKNTGAVTFCKNYGLCSKLFGKITNDTPFLLVPNEEYVITKRYKLTDKDTVGSLEEKASAYVQITEHDWVVSKDVKNEITSFGISFNDAQYGSNTVDGVLTMFIDILNNSKYDGKDIVVEIFSTMSNPRTTSNIPFTNDNGVARYVVPSFPAYTTIRFTTVFDSIPTTIPVPGYPSLAGKHAINTKITSLSGQVPRNNVFFVSYVN